MKTVRILVGLTMMNAAVECCTADDGGLIQQSKELQARLSKIEKQIANLEIYQFKTIDAVVYVGHANHPSFAYFAPLMPEAPAKYTIDPELPAKVRIVGCGYQPTANFTDLRCLQTVAVSPDGNKVDLVVQASEVLNRWWRPGDSPVRNVPRVPDDQGIVQLQIWIVYALKAGTIE